ncbi:MAG: DUF882 domain-containing protein [Steroidobacteraceae bacterium]
MISRRHMLAGAAALSGAAALWPQSLIGAPDAAARRIALTNLHSGERLDIKYFRDGSYDPDAMTSLEVLLRDFRNGEKHAIDPKLMDYLVDVAALIGVPPAYSVISGYRSPQTNERLHERSSGVSQHSLHMQGRAIDVRMSGADCQDMAARAESLKRGGVGFYRASNFVHLDTGAFRTWRG